MISLRKKLVAGIAPLALAIGGGACAPDAPGGGTGTTTTTTALPGSYDILAIGDSNAAGSNDPARGLPWSQRLGSTVRNGATDSHGAGWVTPGTFTGRNFAQELTFENNAVPGSTVVVVQGGVNDLQTKTVGEIEDGMQAFNTIALANGQSVKFVKIIPSRVDSYVQPYDGKRQQINADLDALFPGQVIDCNPGLDADNDFKLDPWFALDSIHLNGAGEQALADCIASGLGL